MRCAFSSNFHTLPPCTLIPYLFLLSPTSFLIPVGKGRTVICRTTLPNSRRVACSLPAVAGWACLTCVTAFFDPVGDMDSHSLQTFCKRLVSKSV